MHLTHLTLSTRYNSSFYDKRPDLKLHIEVDFELSSHVTGVAASQPVSIRLPSPGHVKVIDDQRPQILRSTHLKNQVSLGSMVNALKHDFLLLLSLGDRLQRTEGKASYGILESSEDNGELAAALVLYPRELFPENVITSKITNEEEESEDEDDGHSEKKEENEGKEGEEGKETKDEAATEAKKAPGTLTVCMFTHLLTPNACSEKREAVYYQLAFGLG